jgi:16S rRNA (cytidine1402-2'-O)-methyltransferase
MFQGRRSVAQVDERSSLEWYNNLSRLMSGTLFVVATPIGNLEDITLRALRVLREADLIAAEDTRRTAKLLAHYAIATPSVSFHEHNTRSRLSQLLSRLEGNANIALVTDAGMPGVSDPGVELVRAALEKGIPVDVIPGPSAPLTAAVASGFPLEPFTILGFPPVKGKARTAWFQGVSSIPHSLSFFEAPHRIQKTLRELASLLGDRPILLGRELTKAHQEYQRGTADGLLGHTTDPRGEYTVVVGPKAASDGQVIKASDQDIYAEFGQQPETAGVSRRERVAAVARKHGRSAKEVYSIIEKMKNSGA